MSHLWIDGQACCAADDKLHDIHSPADGKVIGQAAAAGLIPSRMSAIVDLQQQQQSGGGSFREPFYTLVAEKTQNKGVMMHMWRLVVASEKDENEGTY